MCAEHVHFGELNGIAETVVDVRLGGEVDDSIDVVLFHALLHILRIVDVALDKGEIALIHQCAGVVERRAVVQFVE